MVDEEDSASVSNVAVLPEQDGHGRDAELTRAKLYATLEKKKS